MDDRARQVRLPPLNESRICASTIRSHCLAHMALEKYGWRVAEKLFDKMTTGHFREGKNLNDTKFLLECCKDVGLDMEEAKNVLETGKYADVIRTTVSNLLSGGLDHIPVFIINNGYVIDGAPNANSFVTIFRNIESEIMAQEAAEKKKQTEENVVRVSVPSSSNNNSNNTNSTMKKKQLHVQTDISTNELSPDISKTVEVVTPPLTPLGNDGSEDGNEDGLCGRKRSIVEI